ncbi:MAG TPA: DUF748 domain-containing protein [Burkholderiales bacterium]|nr:DUF748 domain-containing protein [Burkholderiales bacterium]
MSRTGIEGLLSRAQQAARGPRARKLALWMAGAVALYALVGFLVAPPIARQQLERVLGEQLGRQVAIERVRLNPFALSASVHGLHVKERDGAADAASFEELHANLALSSIVRFGVVVEAVRLSKPFVRVVRREDGSYSFQDILDRLAAAPPAPPGPAPRFAVYNVTVSDGRVEFDDRPQKAQHAVTDLQVGLPFVSSMPAQVDIEVQPRLSLKVNGAPFEVTGETKPFKDTHETIVRIDIDDLQLARYLEYSPVPLRLRVPSGRLDTRLALSFSLTPDNQLQALSLSGSASLQDLRVQQADGAPLAAIGRLAVHLGSLDLLKRRAVVNSVRIDKPELDLTRAKDGRLNLLAVVPAASGGAPAKPSAPNGPAFTFSVAEIALADGQVRFTDQSPEKPVRVALENVALNVAALGNEPEARATVKFAGDVRDGGKLAYGGALHLAPPATEGVLEVTGLRLRAFAPYVEQVLNVLVTGGALSTKGRLAVEAAEDAPLRLAYRADASVANFASLDKPTSQDLLSWKALAATGIDFELAPLKVAVGQVALSDFYSRLIVNADGTLNLQALVREAGTIGAEPDAKQAAQAPQAPEPAAVQAPPSIRLGKIALRGGRVNFSDFFVKPNFTVMLTSVEGAVTEITPDKAGDVALRGRIHQTAPMEVAGKVNPLAKDLFIDLKASARDIELSPLTPYAVKYAGYGIEKGKLSVKLSYLVENRKLAAENNIYLDQLTFGERVESPTATQLPVLLAVALLKDRNGVIDINLPISGSLDDPEFSLGGIIVKVFVNLIVKAVTAPFALLGSLFGGGEELAFLEFDPGSARLDAEDEDKLKTLAKALEERPGLKLDASGRIEPDADREALKRVAVDRQIKAAKLRDTGGKAADAAALDEVTIDPKEHEKYLTAAYRAAKFDRPRNAIGMLRDLPVPEMERLMLANAQVSEDDLRLLAGARAQAAKDWLVETGKIPAERVFIVAPKMNPEGIKDKGKPTRVDFALK